MIDWQMNWNKGENYGKDNSAQEECFYTRSSQH